MSTSRTGGIAPTHGASAAWLFAVVALTAVLGACGREPAAPPQQAPPAAVALAPALPLARQEAFRDLTERHEWTLRYPEGWMCTTTGSGRCVQEDATGLVAVSLNQTTLQGHQTARSVIAILQDVLTQRGYANVEVSTINDLQGSVPGASAAEAWLTCLHNGTPARAGLAVEVLDITDPSIQWPCSAATYWALEVPTDQVRQKLATLIAVMCSARMEIDLEDKPTWYGKIAQDWAKELGR